MSNYVSLIVRDYADGRILITTDRLSGYLTSHAFASKDLWRKTLEWTGQRFNSENINIAVVNSAKVLPINYLDNFSPVSYGEVNLQYISLHDMSDFDLIYFIGLPPLVSDDTAAAIENYVKNGGGVLIEVPDRGNENINVLTAIEDVYCSSSSRPTYDASYWTVIGQSHYVSSSDAIVNFYSTILFASVSSNWDILMTDTPAPSIQPLNSFNYVGSTSASVMVSYSSSFKNGIVTLD